jgi:photosystem II stability/assembly factor-like uncharacterized protein
MRGMWLAGFGLSAFLGGCSGSGGTAVTPSTPAPSVTAGPIPASTLPLPHTPAGFDVLSVTFVSTQDGWLLAREPCGATVCLSLWRTYDGGQSWNTIATPPAAHAPGPCCQGVAQVRFADTRNGWLFAPELWSTHDGGATWARVTAMEDTFALETNGSQVVAVGFTSQLAAFQIWSAPVGQDGWTASATTIPVGAGPVPAIQVVLQGGTGWILENDRAVVGAARLAGSRWVTWTPPCVDAGGVAMLAASSVSDIVAVCHEGDWNDKPRAVHMYVSANAGSTFARAGVPLPLESASVATPARGVAFVALSPRSDAQGAQVLATFDGGATWTGVHTGAARSYPRYLAFTTIDQGVLIETDDQNLGRLLMTRDGGRRWSEVAP